MNAPGLTTVLRATAITTLMLAAGTSGADSDQNAHANPRLGAEILFLGTAGGPPLRLDRSEPSTLLIVDGREYLIDCGIGTVRRMIAAGIESEQMKTMSRYNLARRPACRNSGRGSGGRTALDPQVT
ncbi:MAG: hypothetical protein ACREUT_11485 [Steroidobacteraceae bacterium]